MVLGKLGRPEEYLQPAIMLKQMNQIEDSFFSLLSHDKKNWSPCLIIFFFASFKISPGFMQKVRVKNLSVT